jgi:hypothetical protein
MKRMKKLAMVLGLATLACGAVAADEQKTKTPTTPGQALESIDASVAQLHKLQIFEVGRLVSSVPQSAFACYGVPCDEAERKQYDDDLIRQAPRLAKLAELATEAHDRKIAPAAAADAPAAAARALNDLAIVEVHDVEDAARARWIADEAKKDGI